jgi:hypothetical protein
MASFRRKLGAFAVAVVMAAGMVMMPASIHAKGKHDKGTFCEQLSAAYSYALTLPEAIRALVVPQLEVFAAAAGCTLP